MTNLLNITIKSKRLMMLPINKQYAKEIFKEFDFDLTKYMCPAPAKTIHDTLEFIADAEKKLILGTSFQCVVLDLSTKEFIGCAGLHNLNTSHPELGLWVKKSKQNKGYGKEIISSLIKWGRNNYNIDYFIYPVDKRNIASRKIPESYSATVARTYLETSMSKRQLDIIEYNIPN